MKTWLKLLLIVLVCFICTISDSVNADVVVGHDYPDSIISMAGYRDVNDSDAANVAEAEKFLVTVSPVNFEISASNKNERDNSLLNGFFTFKKSDKQEFFAIIKQDSLILKTQNSFITYVSELNTRAP